MSTRSSRRRLVSATSLVVLLAPLAACNPFEDPETVDARRAKPCADGQVVDLGMPSSNDRWATFEVERGPVWVGVEGWDPGMLDPSPYHAVIEVGPADRPPEPDKNGNIPSRTGRVVVVDGKWSPLDVGKGSYWLLASSIADTVRLQACGEARIGAVTPAK